MAANENTIEGLRNEYGAASVRGCVNTNNFAFEGLVTLDGVSDALVCGPDGCAPAPEKQDKERATHDNGEEENIM
ncbi:Uncharacterised protein [Corynebacterium pilosum]|uniref:Uncharacterized protein n=2 Tax=Corynebacterium pilosum TaxID=35756 RepID=A0A376CPB3_9CORY|nr:Uncharacterised protein [Corynebacterium pilosum]